jgi:hypothetical protein
MIKWKIFLNGLFSTNKSPNAKFMFKEMKALFYIII